MGTPGNLECANCQDRVQPEKNDRLVYLTVAAEVQRNLLDEVDARAAVPRRSVSWRSRSRESGLLPMLRDALGRGYRVLAG